MTTQRAFRLGGRVALVVAAVLAATAVIGVQALAGKQTYPADYGVGPFSIQSTVSIPVALGGVVCQTFDIKTQNTPSECFRTFLHDDDDPGTARVRHQDADVRPTQALLKGEVELASTGGWSPLVAATVAKSVIGWTVLSAIFFMLWRLLAAAAAGEAFSARTVRYVRGIATLVIASAVLEPALNHFTSAMQLGYSMEAFGPAPALMPASAGVYPDDINLGQLALGGLILLVAEIFRHGAAIEAERRLTV